VKVHDTIRIGTQIFGDDGKRRAKQAAIKKIIKNFCTDEK